MSRFYQGDYVIDTHRSCRHAEVLGVSAGGMVVYIRYASGHTRWVEINRLFKSNERAFARAQAAYLLGVSHAMDTD